MDEKFFGGELNRALAESFPSLSLSSFFFLLHGVGGGGLSTSMPGSPGWSTCSTGAGFVVVYWLK